MSPLLSLYLASGILFLIIEMLTATFYGLAISIASFVLALYVYFTGDTEMTMIHGILLVVLSALLAYFLPKWLSPRNTTGFKSGLDAHIGKSFRLERVGSDWKIKIDGVDYLIDDDSETPDFEVGKKVRLESHRSGVVMVSILQ